jgi:phosphatidylserine decarboxylase
VNFAREGLVFIAIAAVLSALGFVAAVTRRSWALWLLAIVLLVLTLWVAYFFRDPERAGERGERVVVAPADGKVVMVTEVDEPTFLRGRATRISIFMNVFNVHVNRYPVGGVVRYVHRNPGKFLNAAAERASLENEQASVGIEAGGHRVLVRQIAGLVARRIHTYSREGERVEQGERMGLIRFGSRVDVFVPTTADVRVKVGESTVAGVTVISHLPGDDPAVQRSAPDSAARPASAGPAVRP